MAYKIHGDGAVYGIITPYLEKFKQIEYIFDYLDSLSFSGHKFLGTNNICGMVLTKKDYIMKIFNDASVLKSRVWCLPNDWPPWCMNNVDLAENYGHNSTVGRGKKF